jgi:DNA ligase-1
MATTSPMLAASLPCIKKAKALGRSPTPEEMEADLKKLPWGNVAYLGSPKIDGIRGFVRDGVVYSRTWKPIPNKNVQALFGRPELNGLDGELTLGHHTNLTSYNDNQSAIMTVDGPSDVWFNVFDYVQFPGNSFFIRTNQAQRIVSNAHSEALCAQITYVEHDDLRSLEQLYAREEYYVALGYEGYMIRNRQKGYKYGRSTFIEQGLIKLKRFEDGEAEITGFVELKRNTNEPTIDARGLQVRSHHQSGKVGAGILGLFECRDLKTGITFECGSGLDDSTRRKVWENQDAYLGKIIKYKSQPHGVKEKPRSPIFLGFRSLEDM